MKFTKETFKRVIRTFIQAFIACLVVGITTVDFTAEKSLIKSAIIGLITSALAAGISAVMNLEKPEQLGSGRAVMSFEAWVNKYLGKRSDYDGVYGVQCVDLIDCFIDRVLGLTKGFWGNAKYWWLNRNKSEWLKDNFDFITPKYANGELKRGDIGIRTSGTYGHIFVVAESNTNGKFKYYDQNATGNGDKMTLREKPYNSDYINGILRPKNQSNLKAALPSVQNGTYTLRENCGVYKKRTNGTYVIKKVSELTADGRKKATSSRKSANAYLKKGTKVTISKTVKDDDNNLWAVIPSGYILIFHHNIQKLRIS